MSYAVLLVVVAITGYVYCHAHSGEQKKLEWHAKRGGLYYRYAAFGVLFSIFGYFLYLIVYSSRPSFLVDAARFFLAPIDSVFPGNWKKIHFFFGISASSIFLSYVSGKLRIFSRAANANSLIYKEIQHSEDSFSRLLLVAMENRLTVLINLEGGKAYVGHPLEFYSPYFDHGWLQILPVMSGYRDKDTQKLILNTEYSKSIQGYIKERLIMTSKRAFKPRIDDFSLTIKVDKIVSLTIFDIPLYVNEVLGQMPSNARKQ